MHFCALFENNSFYVCVCVCVCVCMWRVWGRGDVCTGFWWGNLRERPLGRPRRRWEDNIKTDLQEEGGGCGD